jgi:hypothetical protein
MAQAHAGDLGSPVQRDLPYKKTPYRNALQSLSLEQSIHLRNGVKKYAKGIFTKLLEEIGDL